MILGTIGGSKLKGASDLLGVGALVAQTNEDIKNRRTLVSGQSIPLTNDRINFPKFYIKKYLNI